MPLSKPFSESLFAAPSTTPNANANEEISISSAPGPASTLAGDDFSATVGDIVKALAKGRKFTVNDEPTVKLYDVNRYQFLPQLNHRYSYYDGRILTMTAMTPHPTG